MAQNQSLSTQEDGDILHVSKSTIYDLIRKGEIHSYKIGRKVRFTQEDVDTLLRVLLKGQPLYSTVMTKQECQDSIDYVNSPEWHADPDAPEQTPEQLEARRQEIIAYYTAEMAKAPEEKPIIHGFEDSGTPNEVSGDATVDGAKYEINIMNRFGGGNEEGGVVV